MSNEVESTIEMIENYHKKGGDYIIPVEVVNDIKNLIIELEKEKNNMFDTGIKECLRIRDMKDKEIERLNKTNNEIFKANETLVEEIERLNNIINEALGIVNERFNYYSNHKNNNQEYLEDWGNIFNILLRRDNK